MKRRIVWIGFSVALALAASALLLFIGGSATPVQASSLPGQFIAGSQGENTILARRAISIPFGIQSDLELVNARQVEVTGHGSCTSDGTAYRLRTTVSQGSTMAHGFLQGVCQGDDAFMWSTIATTNPAKEFQPGVAEACGLAIVYTHRDGAIVKQWCKEVTLGAPTP